MSRPPEEIMGYMPRRRWNDGLERVQLLVRGAIALAVLVAVTFWGLS